MEHPKTDDMIAATTGPLVLSDCRALVVITGSRALVGPIGVRPACAAGARRAEPASLEPLVAQLDVAARETPPAEPEIAAPHPLRAGARPDWFKPVETIAAPRKAAEAKPAARQHANPKPAAPRHAGPRPPFRHWPLATAASVALALCGGYLSGAAISGRAIDQVELAQLRERIALLEAARERDDAQGARASLASLRMEMETAWATTLDQSAALSTRMDQLDHDAAARLDKFEKVLATRDATASIRVAPSASARPVDNVTTVARAPSRPHAAAADWALLSVIEGVANVEGPGGVRQVLPGDIIPGVGPVRSIERRGGQWVVVTSQGVIDQSHAGGGYAYSPNE